MLQIPSITLNNGLKIPQIGLGVYKDTNEQAEFAVAAAIKNGYRLIDTAPLYGNELGVGKGVIKSGVPREEVYITTKLWNYDHGYENTLAAFQASRRKLGVDYIDIYLIHWPLANKGDVPGTWRAFEELYEAGKIRAIGVCNFRIQDLERLREISPTVPVINQVELHPDFQQRELRKYCKDNSIAVQSWSPIGGSGNAILSNPTIQKIASKYNKTPAQIALRWHVQSGLIAIPKSVHEKRIKQNINIFDFSLSSEDMESIEYLDGGNRRGPDPATMTTSYKL